MVDAGRVRVAPGRRNRAPAVLELSRRTVVVARDVSGIPAPGVMAGLRQPERSVGLRTMEGQAAADRGGVLSCGVRHAGRTRARVSLGLRSAKRAPWTFRLRWMGAATGRTASRGPERMGRRRSRGQRMGVDVDGVYAATRFQADGVVSRILRRLL